MCGDTCRSDIVASNNQCLSPPLSLALFNSLKLTHKVYPYGFLCFHILDFSTLITLEDFQFHLSLEKNLALGHCVCLVWPWEKHKLRTLRKKTKVMASCLQRNHSETANTSGNNCCKELGFLQCPESHPGCKYRKPILPLSCKCDA